MSEIQDQIPSQRQDPRFHPLDFTKGSQMQAPKEPPESKTILAMALSLSPKYHFTGQQPPTPPPLVTESSTARPSSLTIKTSANPQAQNPTINTPLWPAYASPYTCLSLPQTLYSSDKFTLSNPANHRPNRQAA